VRLFSWSVDVRLTEDEMDEIAERAAKRALELVYAEVGKSVLKKLFWYAGAAAIGLFVWLKT
jgi:hypothetical protein